MTEDLQHALASTIASMQDAVSGAKGFALEQAPQIVRELLHWMLVKHVFLTCLSLGVLAFLIYSACWVVKRLRTEQYPIEEDIFCIGSVIWLVVSALIAIVCVCQLFESLSYAVEAYFFPKWFLIEQAAELLK